MRFVKFICCVLIVVFQMSSAVGQVTQQALETDTPTFSNVSGGGSGLTNLNASQLSSGTVAATRLPAVFNVSQATNMIVSSAVNYNVLNTDSIVELNGNLTATLPTAVGIKGKSFTVVCLTAGTNGILSTSSQTFLGYGQTAATKWTNSVVGRSSTFVSDGANWIVLKSDN